jgi:GT2 family glycosyltransferase
LYHAAVNTVVSRPDASTSDGDECPNAGSSSTDESSTTSVEPTETTDPRIASRREWLVPDRPVRTSVVLVTYRLGRDDLERTLDALATQTTGEFEIVVVDNGIGWDLEAELATRDRVGVYARLTQNHGITVGRNVGARLARGELLLFLDDDGIPGERFVAAHSRLHDEEDIVAARGRVCPRHDTIYNRLQRHYDLGSEPCPYFINIEGNASFDRETFLEHGGFLEALDGRAGHEGLELTYRMVADGSIDREQVVYHPEAVIYHDYARTVLEFVRKRTDRTRKATRLEAEHDQLFEFARSYTDASPEEPELNSVDYLMAGFLAAIVRLVRRVPKA